jgi:hypothetical protein
MQIIPFLGSRDRFSDRCQVVTPESALPHQFAAAVKESSGVNGLERFEVRWLWDESGP